MVMHPTVSVRARMSNYMILFYLDEITYTYRNPDAGLTNLCQQQAPLLANVKLGSREVV